MAGALVVALFLFGVLAALLVDAFGDDEIKLEDRLVDAGTADTSATRIFRDYLIPFEVVVDAAARRAGRRRRARAEGLTRCC